MTNQRVVKICNAFSIQMLKGSGNYTINITRVSQDAARSIVKEATVVLSYIGHADTARIAGKALGIELGVIRASLELEDGEKMLVAQFTGGRLPEGATELPTGVTLEFFVVEVKDREPDVGAPLPPEMRSRLYKLGVGR